MVEHEPGGERLNLLGRPMPSGFDVRVVVLWPGCERLYEAAEWRDALVEVDRGQVDREFCGGAHRRFGPSDLLWLAGLSLRALRNRQWEPAVLVALFRTRQDPGLRPSGTERDDKSGGCRLNVHDDHYARRRPRT